MPLRPGDSLERYAILALLGEGGMGKVYRARDTRLQREVALKVLHEEDLEGAPGTTGGGARILREARAAATLDHPNVVAIHDVGEAEEPDGKRVAYLAMELVQGQSLRAWIRAGSLALEERIRIVADVARALRAAHAAGLVHRDVKPENVMIREDGAVKVLDFGIARRAYAQVDATSTTEAQILSTLTSQGLRVGTPYYMSPEQMRCEALDGRSDQFAWGVVAWEVIAGRPVWGEMIDALLLVSSVLSKMPERLDALDPRVPAYVADTVERALQKAPKDRFASMDALLEALHARASAAPRGEAAPRAREGASAAISDVRATPPAEPALPVQPRASKKALRFALLAGASALGIGAVFVVTRALRPPAAAPPDAAPPHCTAKVCTQVNGGAPSRCREDGRCAPLASDDCQPHADPAALESDDTVWFGAMFSKDDPADDGEAEMHAVDLARTDFAQMMSGFARLPGESHARPFGLVACDDGKDAMRAARHLVEDVHVPAIIGFRSSAELIDVGSALLVPNGVLGMVSVSTSPLVTRLPNRPGAPRMIWRTTFSSTEQAKAIGHVVPEMIEPQVRATAKVGAEAPIRVAFVRSKVRGGTTFDDLVLNHLRFNGKSALENEARYRVFVLDEDDPARAATDGADLVKRLSAFAPHVIIYGVGPRSFAHVLFPLESAWPAGRARPRYLFGGSFQKELLDWMGNATERRRRVLGLQVISTPINGRFVMHYNETASVPSTRTDSPNSSYDAFYILAYATYALGDEPVTGAALSRAIGRLVPPGKPIDVGPAAIFDGYSALRHDEHIDLNGATGSLDFDLATGEAPFDEAILCPDVDASGHAFDSIESGVIFRSASGTLEGTPRCP